MNKYYAIAMLAALRANQSNIDELEKIRRVCTEHEISYNIKTWDEAVSAAYAANDVLFGCIRSTLGDTTSTTNELFETLKKRAKNK